jgi:glucokinase
MTAHATARQGQLLLAGDIGGTKTLLALAQWDGAVPRILFRQRYASAGQPAFEAMLESFLAEARAAGTVDGPIGHACFGVAGPIAGRQAKPTYLPWTLDADALEQRFGIGGAELVNDFAAAAAGVLTLDAAELAVLQKGEPEEHGPRVVLGAGTGLGVAFIIWSGDDWQVVSGEGGHAGFAPADEEQIALWRCLQARYGRVTSERVVSGAGLADIYRCLVQGGLAPDAPDPLAAADPPAAIAQAAARGAPAAMRAQDIFVDAYGAFAGDLALTVLARGGVFLAGGIAPKVLPRLRAGGFCAAFNAKQGHGTLNRRVPVYVVTNEHLGLQGAAWLAARAGRGP